jgi:hypothetical protein
VAWLACLALAADELGVCNLFIWENFMKLLFEEFWENNF